MTLEVIAYVAAGVWLLLASATSAAARMSNTGRASRFAVFTVWASLLVAAVTMFMDEILIAGVYVVCALVAFVTIIRVQR